MGLDANKEVNKAGEELSKKAGFEMTPDTETAIQTLVAPIVGSVLAASLAAAAVDLIAKLVVTNVKESDVSGDRDLKPTEQKTAVSKSEAAASETEGKLSKDGVSGQDGSIKANETEAKASTGEATAAEAGAQAMRTKAGAADIETKALKMT